MGCKVCVQLMDLSFWAGVTDGSVVVEDVGFDARAVAASKGYAAEIDTYDLL